MAVSGLGAASGWQEIAHRGVELGCHRPRERRHSRAMQCPCDSGATLSECCGPYIDGSSMPATAEQLMRSRYTAYTRANIDYVINTHHPDTRDSLDERATRSWAENATWLGLKIVETQAGGEGDDEGIVEFEAYYKLRGRDQHHHERSTFVRDDGRWYFRDGDAIAQQPERRASPKIGRNDPCSCDSGKKFKKCCGRPGKVD